MFDALKSFLGEITGETAAQREFGDADYRLAAAALLVHVADVDGVIDPAEQRRLRQLLAEKFGLDAGATARLISEAIRSDRESIDLYHFTSVLTRALDRAGRLKVIEMMWEIAYADGHVVEMAENVVWRVAELLGVTSHERIALRHRVAEHKAAEASGEAGGDETIVGPWARPGTA